MATLRREPRNSNVPALAALAAVALAWITPFAAVAQTPDSPERQPPPDRPEPPPRPELPPQPNPPPPGPEQFAPPGEEPPPDVDEVGRAGPGPATRGAGPGRPRRAEELAALLFRPRPQDLGPLRPGEEEVLMNFARERTPRIYRALEWFRDRRPPAFHQRLSGMAPRLRQLRRVYEHNPALGDALRAHMESMFEIKRRTQVLGENEPGSALRERTIEELRDLVADSVAREHEALLLLADELDRRREERVTAWVDYLTSTIEPDFPRLPETIRDLVRQYRAASGEAERATVRDEMRARVEKFLATETAALRERAERRRAGAAEEVDRRLEELIADAERPGPPMGPRGPRRGPMPPP